MSSTVVRNGEGHPWPGGLKEIIIACDHPGCTTQYTDKEIQAAGGLKEMGWEVPRCVGPIHHYCPAHRPSLLQGKE